MTTSNEQLPPADEGRRSSEGLGRTRRRGPVEIGAVHRGAYFDWSQAGCGFGQLSFSTDKQGRLTCDSECMGREWVRQALHALADHVADTAHFTDFPECSGDAASCPENEGRGCCGGKRPNAELCGERSESERVTVVRPVEYWRER